MVSLSKRGSFNYIYMERFDVFYRRSKRKTEKGPSKSLIYFKKVMTLRKVVCGERTCFSHETLAIKRNKVLIAFIAYISVLNTLHVVRIWGMYSEQVLLAFIPVCCKNVEIRNAGSGGSAKTYVWGYKSSVNVRSKSDWRVAENYKQREKLTAVHRINVAGIPWREGIRKV